MNTLDNLPFEDAGECRGRVHKMLLRGGSATWFDGKNTRMLVHTPALHRPLTRLPWPLSALQAHLIEYAVYEGKLENPPGRPIFTHVYKKSEINQAIETFLSGSEPDTTGCIIED